MSPPAARFGEYTCTLHSTDFIKQLITFTKELFSRRIVIHEIAPALLARSEIHALLHTGHVVLSIDGVNITGMSLRRLAQFFTEDEGKLDKKKKSVMHQHVLRCVDRQREKVEVAMLKDCSIRAIRYNSLDLLGYPYEEMQGLLQRIHAKIWQHRLDEAYRELLVLPICADPMISLLKLEVDLIRVLISNDTLYLQKARQNGTQTVDWLQKMDDLQSLSVASKITVRLSLAEALSNLGVCQFIADSKLHAITTLRRAATMYMELNRRLHVDPSIAQRMPTTLFKSMKARVDFGMGMLHICSSMLVNHQPVDWLVSLVSVECDPVKGLRHLLDCAQVADFPNIRSTWAALVLFYSSAALRMVRQHKDNSLELADQLAREVRDTQQTFVKRFPQSILFLWSASINDGDESTNTLLSRALALLSNDERAHLLFFDIGYQLFLIRDFDKAAAQFMPICKCPTAPSKLRGLCSIFLAVGYLMQAFHPLQGQLKESAKSIQQAQLWHSVRLLLRSALRFFALASHNGDVEVACLTQRLEVYLTRSDRYFALLPCEILYVYCSKYNFTTSRNKALGNRQHHVDALKYLDEMRAMSKFSRYMEAPLQEEVSIVGEWNLQRAIVLYHLNHFDNAQLQLNSIHVSLPHLVPKSYVPPISCVYQLQMWLERRTFNPASLLILAKKYVDGRELMAYEYNYLYAGKLKAMLMLITRMELNHL